MKWLLLVVLFPFVGACWLIPTTHIDYVDFVRHDGITYVAPFNSVGRALTENDLGQEIFRVVQKLDGSGRGPYYQTQDGDAAFIRAGDPVHAVRGYAPTFRLAAHHDGRLVLYEADSNSRAVRGADLLDIDGKVAGIALLSQKDSRTVLGRITDAARVRELVRLVVEAPVRPESPPPRPTEPAAHTEPATPTTAITPRTMFTELVAFELSDGTATVRGYAIDNGILGRGIAVGGAFREAILELRAAAPTPTPVPAVVNLATRYDLARATRVAVKSLSGFKEDALSVAALAAALDADVPGRAPEPLTNAYIVVFFQFADHNVSFAYDDSSALLTVVDPHDELAVRATAEFARLIAAAR